MEKKNSKGSKCNPVCEKLLKALTGHPSFRKFRPLSNRQQESKPPTPKTEAPIRTVRPPLVSVQERIKDKKELDPSYSLQIHEHEDNNVRGKPKHKSEKEEKHMHTGGNDYEVEKEGNKSREDINDVFSGYINRARHKLRSMASSKGHDSGKKKKEKESVKDEQFSDYISRAKNKLKATSSSVGFGKGRSMKRE